MVETALLPFGLTDICGRVRDLDNGEFPIVRDLDRAEEDLLMGDAFDVLKSSGRRSSVGEASGKFES